MQFPEMALRNQEKLLVLTLIAFEWRTANSHNPDQDICHWQSMCYKTDLRLNISVREIFSESGSPRLMKKYDEGALIPVSQEFASF